MHSSNRETRITYKIYKSMYIAAHITNPIHFDSPSKHFKIIELVFCRLTVEEHLWFYSRLKGMATHDIKQETER